VRDPKPLTGQHASAQTDNPATIFENPTEVLADPRLSPDEKKKVLNTWEQDAQHMTASNEGMPGPKEGIDPMTIIGWRK
jgi:hypothetical protein